MKKVLFGIFAHPDDEAFGPAATLYKLAQDGVDVHLILVTDGESGANPDSVPDLAAVRLEEWQKSGKIIGVRSQHALHFPDGKLSNSLYHEISKELEDHIRDILSSYKDDTAADIMTFDEGGITGHLDHIAVSRITTYVYLKLRESSDLPAKIGTLKYFCLANCMAPNTANNWLYMSCGKTDESCDEIIDFSDVIDKKREIMEAHHSQRNDYQALTARQESIKNPCRYKDHFCHFKG